MASSVSFGDTNSGHQIGINHGTVNTQEERSEVYNTHGGAVFNGHLSARGDININNITTIRPLAQSIYKSLFNSSEVFSQVKNELGLLVSVLAATEDFVPNFRPDEPKLAELNDILAGCHSVLRDLERIKDHFDNVGPQTQVTWERMGWGVDELTEIRGKFSLHIQVLNLLLNSNLLRSSQQNVEQMLKTFIDEIRSGKRESAAMSNASTGSLSLDEKEAWRALRRELQSIGITPDLFTQHRDFILSTLQALLIQGEITDFPKNLDVESLDGIETTYKVASAKPDSSLRAGRQWSRESSVASLYDPGEEIVPSDKPTIPTKGSSHVCRSCDEALGGQFVRALGGEFHLDCFKCEDCGRITASKFFSFKSNDGSREFPLCETDYFRRFNLLCHECGRALRSNYITALDRKYHIEHFTCSVCSTIIAGTDRYYAKDEQIYCEFHYSSQIADRCHKCHAAILKEYCEIVRNGQYQYWHLECYNSQKLVK